MSETDQLRKEINELRGRLAHLQERLEREEQQAWSEFQAERNKVLRVTPMFAGLLRNLHR